MEQNVAIYNYKKDDYRIINASNSEDMLKIIRKTADDLNWKNEYCVVKSVKNGQIQW